MPVPASATVRAAIAAFDKQFESTFNAHDSQQLAALFTENGSIMPPGAPLQRGREAIAVAFQHVAASGVDHVKQELIDILASDASDTPDLIIEQSHITFYTKDDHVADKSKYVCIYTQEGGAWKLLWNIFNSDGPATQQQ